MTESLNSLKRLLTHAKSLSGKFEEILFPLKTEIQEINKRISDIEVELGKEQIVSIAVLGDTGAGKSSLINAILGNHYLPWSNSDICTAAITRIRFKNLSKFKISIKFTSEKEWENVLKLALKEMYSNKEYFESEQKQMDEPITKKRFEPSDKDERDRIKAIYGLESYKNFTENLDTDFLEPGENLKFILKNQILIEEVDTAEEVLVTLEKYLTKTGDKDQYWPLVEDVLVEGPFDSLKYGAELVDLPGLSDPNQARAAKTIKFIDQAKFILIAYESWRPPSEVIQDVFRNNRLLEDRLIQSAREYALLFVGTKSDQFGDKDRKFKVLGDEATLEQKAKFLKIERKESLFRALDEFAERICSEHILVERTASDLRKSILSSSYFFTSALEFENINSANGDTSKFAENKFKTPQDTEIPQLIEHLKLLTVDVGPRVLYRRMWNDLGAIESSFKILFNTKFVQFMNLNELNTERINKLKYQINQFTEKVNLEAIELSDELKKSIDEGRQSFFLRTETDESNLIRSQIEFGIYLRSKHWATLRATTVRGGWFRSSSGEVIDLAVEASKPLINRFIGPWTNFFGNVLIDTLNILSYRMEAIANNYSEVINLACEHISDVTQFTDGLSELLSSIENFLSSDIDKLIKSIHDLIDINKKSLTDLITSNVRSVISPAILEASEEKGKGMKERMTLTLIEGVSKLAPETYDFVRLQIEEAVNTATSNVTDFISNIPSIANSYTKPIANYFDGLQKSPDRIHPKNFDELRNQINLFSKELTFSAKEISEFLGQFNISQEILVSNINRTSFDSDSSSNKPLIVIDGSNVATFRPKKGVVTTSLVDLIECSKSARKEFSESEIRIFVDSNFRHLLQSSAEKEMYKELAGQRRIIEGAPGVVGDKIFLKDIRNNGGRVISNDYFLKEKAIYPFVTEPGRVITWTRMSRDNWIFEPRTKFKRNSPSEK